MKCNLLLDYTQGTRGLSRVVKVIKIARPVSRNAWAAKLLNSFPVVMIVWENNTTQERQ